MFGIQIYSHPLGENMSKVNFNTSEGDEQKIEKLCKFHKKETKTALVRLLIDNEYTALVKGGLIKP